MALSDVLLLRVNSVAIGRKADMGAQMVAGVQHQLTRLSGLGRSTTLARSQPVRKKPEGCSQSVLRRCTNAAAHDVVRRRGCSFELGKLPAIEIEHEQANRR